MMNRSESLESLQNQLFFSPEAQVFVILDGASVPRLLKQLEQYQPEHDCLYRGQLTPDLAEVVPYLVHLEKNSEFLWWILEGYGQHWGIFAASSAELRTLRQHFHSLLTVQDSRGNSFYRHGIAKAEKYAIHREREVERYLDLMFLLAFEFDTYPWASRILQKDWEASVKLEVFYAKQEVNDAKQRSSRPQSGQLV